MEALELLEIIQQGENSQVQFKERLNDAHGISQELVALSNSTGGLVIIGVNDQYGLPNGLTYQELQNANNLLVNASSNNVHPSIIIRTETVRVGEHNLIVVHVNEGLNKPYKDRNGVIWLKNGSDKRRVTANEEIARLLQSSKTLFADEMVIQGSSLADLNVDLFKKFIQAKYRKKFDELDVDLHTSLQNLNLTKDGSLTLAGMLLFGQNPQKYRPQFSVQCLSVAGVNLTGSSFIDNEPAFEGDLKTIYDRTIAFIERSVRKIQAGKSFNSLPVWEIPLEVFEELVVNALVHRDYFVHTTIKVYIFSDRIEIVSPGKLPNSLTIENIKNGISIPRNPILQSIAQYLLPYKGLGTGVSRALALYPEIDLINKFNPEQFIAVVRRPVI